MQNPTKIRRITTVLTAAMMLWTSASWAQSDIGDAVAFDGDHKPVEIYQQNQRVGLAWVFPSGNPCQYTEHWYLSPSYVYPNSLGAGECRSTKGKKPKGVKRPAATNIMLNLAPIAASIPKPSISPRPDSRTGTTRASRIKMSVRTNSDRNAADSPPRSMNPGPKMGTGV